MGGTPQDPPILTPLGKYFCELKKLTHAKYKLNRSILGAPNFTYRIFDFFNFCMGATLKSAPILTKLSQKLKET